MVRVCCCLLDWLAGSEVVRVTIVEEATDVVARKRFGFGSVAFLTAGFLTAGFFAAGFGGDLAETDGFFLFMVSFFDRTLEVLRVFDRQLGHMRWC